MLAMIAAESKTLSFPLLPSTGDAAAVARFSCLRAPVTNEFTGSDRQQDRHQPFPV